MSQRHRTDNGSYVSRPYTPTRVTGRNFELPIKIVPGGRLSQVVRQWKLGDEVEWRGPYYGDVLWDTHKASCLGMFHFDDGVRCTLAMAITMLSYLLLVAGGVGIAPFVRLLNELLENDNDETRVRLLYCVRKGSDILFKELLAQWAQHWNVKIVIFGPDVEKTSIHYLFGHVAERLNEDHFREQLRALCGDNLDRAAVGVCGRLTLEKDVVNFATRAGIEHLNIRRFLA